MRQRSFQFNNFSFQDQIESLKQEVDILKKRCERVEKEKSDILLRRLANIDTANKYTSGRTSEVLKLQQKVNELTSQNEDLKDEKKHLSLRIKEMEVDIEVSMYKIQNSSFFYSSSILLYSSLLYSIFSNEIFLLCSLVRQ